MSPNLHLYDVSFLLIGWFSRSTAGRESSYLGWPPGGERCNLVRIDLHSEMQDFAKVRQASRRRAIRVTEHKEPGNCVVSRSAFWVICLAGRCTISKMCSPKSSAPSLFYFLFFFAFFGQILLQHLRLEAPKALQAETNLAQTVMSRFRHSGLQKGSGVQRGATGSTK